MPAAIDWTPELETAVLDGIESGLTLRQVAANNNISDSLILKKVRENEEFCKQYTRVLEMRTDADFEGLIDLVDEQPKVTQYGVDSAWVNWQRMRVDTRKWALSKRNPKKYGEKTTLAGDPDNPLNLGLAEVIAEARKRAGKS